MYFNRSCDALKVSLVLIQKLQVMGGNDYKCKFDLQIRRHPLHLTSQDATSFAILC